MNRFPLASQSKQKGAVLLEALIAVVIFSFGLLALAGLQAVMIKNTDDAKYRAEASFIAQQKLGEIWANAQNLGSLADYVDNEDLSNRLPNGTRTVTVGADRLVTITVAWQMPGSTETHNYTTNARIEGLEP